MLTILFENICIIIYKILIWIVILVLYFWFEFQTCLQISCWNLFIIWLLMKPIFFQIIFIKTIILILICLSQKITMKKVKWLENIMAHSKRKWSITGLTFINSLIRKITSFTKVWQSMLVLMLVLFDQCAINNF